MYETPPELRVLVLLPPAYIPKFPCSHQANLFNTYLDGVNHVLTPVNEKPFGLFDTGEKEMERHATVGREEDFFFWPRYSAI
jgi:hypothetical protein